MKLWLTAQEIADLALDGFPSTKRGVQKLADRDEWAGSGLARKREGREGGGGLEYHIDLLPLPQRLQYAGTFVRVEREDYQTETTNELTRRECSVRDAKLIVLKVAERFRKTCGMGGTASDHLFTQLFEDGKVPLPEWVLENVKTVSRRSLARWRKDMREDINRLAHDPSKARKGTGVLDRAESGEVRAYCLATYVTNQFFSAKHIRNAAVQRFGESVLIETAQGQRRVPMPPLRTFQNALKGWKNEDKNALLKLTDPDAYKSKVRFSASGANRVDRLNERWEIDASPSDVMTTDGRMNIYAAIDLYSRRVIILVTATPRAAAVGLLIRKCLIAWGVPEVIKTDNGSDFTARATVRLLDALAIEQQLSAPYSPEQKGTVERVIGTFQRDFAATLPGFIGHSVADRKVIEARKSFAARLGTDDAKLFNVEMSAAELQQQADQWADESYGNTAHSGLKGKTPNDVARAWMEPVKAISDPAALDVLLAPVAGQDGLRRVTNQGIRVAGEFYYTGDVMPGTDILARHDPEDLGRLWLFDPDGETFLGEAVNPDLAGLDPAATIQKVRAMQKKVEEDQLATIRKQKRAITPRTVADAQRATYQRNADVLSFPKPTEKHETAKTRAAATVKAKRAPKPLSDAEHQTMQRLARSAPKPTAVQSIKQRETPEDRFERAKRFEARIRAGEPLTQDDAFWLTNYQAGAEYRARNLLWNEREARQASVPPAS
ncbi:DDE-type integrase/transposase/recombinase [Labrenzia sp. DG1229]|uniref:DDE-type integrase/transposase/recombinase n=1 Tax=Labrenzia sp. DG1229 TaxID=681847 RepID=UPI00048D290A|nr:DDE-type integrase/transposase/recombinase [Labrenzia sp. DG1229]